MATTPKPTLVGNIKGKYKDYSTQVDPAEEAAKQASLAKYQNVSTEYSQAVAAYTSIPDSGDPATFAAKETARIYMDQKEAELGYYQAKAQIDVTPAKRTAVGEDGESPTTASPENNQTTSTPEETTTTSEETTTTSEAAEEDIDGFYSDTNPTYVLDKRVQVLRTPDKSKHIFFLESYKSIYNTIRNLETEEDVDNSDSKDRDALQDSLRFDTEKIKIIINRSGIIRSIRDEEKALDEFEFQLYLPPNEGKAKEDYMVDSCLWCTTSFAEEFYFIPEEYSSVLAPMEADSVFTFPVLFISDVKDKKLSPLYNIKYYNLFYDHDTKTIDMVFWTNVRSGWLADTTGEVEFYSAYPFTREKDLRNVGRVLMATSGWYDKVLIETKTKNDKGVEVTEQFRRNIFIFNTPYLVHNPGVGGEFDSNQYEPVVDSIPWGFKFVEFTS